MTIPLSFLPEEEFRRCIPPDEEAGFGSLATSRGHLPLRALEVRARIDGLLTQVRVAQTFVNAFPEPLEATYVFPLPDRAAVTSFRMEVGGRVVEGVLKERGAARREYEVAMRAGHRAGIAEEERPGVFTLRVGNLMPGEAATVRLTLSGPVAYDSGEVTFRFPLVVAPRYIPGVPLPGPAVGDGTAVDTDAVPDASRISPPVLLPGYPNPVRLALSVEVYPGGLPVSDLSCSLHEAVAEGWDGGFRVSLQPGERLNRDFVLRYRFGEEAVRTSLFLLPDRENRQEGTFALTVVPPLKQAQAVRPRDVVFVLDRSGSMAGWKMVAARRALARMVDALTERDRFTVYAFDDRLETPPDFRGAGLVEATDRNRFRAVEFLARVESRGGTEMAGPLDLAVKQLTGERDRILVLVTDGQVGNEDQILRGLGQRLTGIRIFTLGIDQAVNEAFLKRLAALGGCCCDVVESEDRLDEVMGKVQRRVGTPLLTGLRLEAAGLRLDPATVTPPRLPDLFAGAAVTVLGRYQGAPEGAVKLHGCDEAGRPWAQTVYGKLSESPAVAQVWARSQVRALEDRFVIGDGDPAALEKQIVGLSLRFGVLCRFTAYVAVDRSEVVNEGGRQHQIVQPVEAPAGWDMLERALPLACMAPRAAGSTKAKLAKQVLGDRNARSRASKKTRSLDDADSLAEMLPEDEDTDSVESRLTVFEEAESAPPPPPCASAPTPAAPPAEKDEYFSGTMAAFGDHAKPGLVGKIFRALFGEALPHNEEAETKAATGKLLDLSAYRRRALDMLEALNKAVVSPATDKARLLGVLAVQLAALVEDLKSIGAPVGVLQPLERLHADLRQLLTSDRPQEAEVNRLWSESEKALRAFSGTEAAASRK
jgi:Ca-activated chloride channel family protein